MKSYLQLLLTIITLGSISDSFAQEVFIGDTLVVRFDNWTGVGFAPESSTGRIDSRSWIVNGLTDGGMDFGDTKIGGDFGRGISSGRVTTGGVYAFTPAVDVRLLGFQPTGTDLAPGSATLRVRFPNLIETTGLVVAYDLWIYNDQDRSTVIELEWSKDGVSFYPSSGGNTSTPASAEVGVQWRKQSVIGYLATNEIESDSFIYIRWNMRDGAGTGSRDEWGLGEIRIHIDDDLTISPPTPIATLLKYDFDADTDTPSEKSIDQFDARFGIVGANRTGYSTGSPGRAANSNGWTQINSAWYIRLSTVGFSNISVQSKQYSSPTGPKIFNIEWSSDSLSWKYLLTVEVGGTFANIQPDRGIPLPADAENKPRVWLRWRLASGISVGGGDISSTGTSRIDEIAITGIPIPPLPPIISSTYIASSSNTISGFVELSSHGTAIVNSIDLSCSQVDGDTSFVDHLPVAIRSSIHFQTGPLPQPSTWECRVIATSEAGTSTSETYQLSIDPPPLPYALKPTIQARNIQLVARSDSSMHIRWDRGDGEFSILAVVPEGEAGCLTDTSFTYISHPNLNHTSTTRNGCKVVSNGSDSQAIVYGFVSLQSEIFAVLEFNGEPGRENYLETDQELVKFQTRADIPRPIEHFRTQLVTEDRVVFAWNTPTVGASKVFIADEVPTRGMVMDYLDGKVTATEIIESGCQNAPCTILRELIHDKKVFAFNVNGPIGHQSVQVQPFLVWEPSWPDPQIGRLLSEWNFDSQSNFPSWSVWEHETVSVSVVGARDRGFAGGFTGMASYTDQWHEPNLSKSWEMIITTHGLISAVAEFRIISSASGPARFRVVCDVYGDVFTSDQVVAAASTWATSTAHKVEIPSNCLNQPLVRLLITPYGDVALNGNAISRAGTSRIDDIRIYGMYQSNAAPLMGNLNLVANSDHGVTLTGSWQSAAGLIPVSQSLKIESSSNVVEHFHPVSGMGYHFEMIDLEPATQYAISHCGYLVSTSACSQPLVVHTPHRVPDRPSIISHKVIEQDAVELTGAAGAYGIIVLSALVGTSEPKLADSVSVGNQYLDGIIVTERQASLEAVRIGGLRPGATYRFWIVAVSGPDSLARYSKSPHSYIDIEIPRLAEPDAPELTMKTSERDFESVKLAVTFSFEPKVLITITPYDRLPSPPIDDVTYRFGTRYNTGEVIGTETYVVGDVHNGLLHILGLPLGKKWRLRVYSINELHGAITYSRIYFQHIFETLPDPVANPMTAYDLWNAALGDTVSTVGSVLWNNNEHLLVRLEGGNMMVSYDMSTNSSWKRLQSLALLGIKQSYGLELITHTVLGNESEDSIQLHNLHPDTPNLNTMQYSQVMIGNLLETSFKCEDGRPMYRQRGLNSRNVCLIGVDVSPQKGAFANEWAIKGFPLFELGTSSLKVLVDSDKDITVYSPPQTLLVLPNKDQIISWTATQDTNIEFKWDYKAAIRPYDHFPDSVAADMYFITRTPNGRIVMDRKLDNDTRSLSLNAKELHRSHADDDSSQLSVDIEWTVSMFNMLASDASEFGSLEWIPFRLLRLKALYDTDVMDIPTSFKLDPARPNPFNPSTTIRVYVPATGDLDMKMYDILGRSLKTIHSGQIRAGVHDIITDAGRLSSGVYIVRASYRDTIISQLVTLVK